MKYQLKEPIHWGSETVRELEFRVPKAKDFRKLPTEIKIDNILNLAGDLCGKPPSFMDELSAMDFREVTRIVSDFLEPSQATGKG